MRILLIKPPLNKNLLAPNNDEPLEPEYVAAAAEGHEVDILDMRLEKNLWKKLNKKVAAQTNIEALRILRKWGISVSPPPDRRPGFHQGRFPSAFPAGLHGFDPAAGNGAIRE